MDAKEKDTGAAAMPRRSQSPLRWFGKKVDYGLTKGFGIVGRAVANRPYITMACCLVLTIGLAFGIIRINVVTDSEKLYTPQDNQAFSDRTYVDSLYGYPTRTTYIYITGPDVDGSNILTKPALLAFLDLYNQILNLTASTDLGPVTLQSANVCHRPGGANTPCDVLSVLDYWGYNATSIANDPDIGKTAGTLGALDRLGRTIPPSQVMGALIRSTTSTSILSAEAFQLVIQNQNNKDSVDSSSTDPVINHWEEAVTSLVNDVYSSPFISVFIDTSWGENDVSNKAIYSDVNLLVIGYILLAVYGAIVLSKRHPYLSSGALATANIVSIGMAVVCSYGVCMLAGVEFSLVVQLLALLLLGLGTDDMLVTMTAHEETKWEMSATSTLADRISLTVARARRGVIVASATNLVAFITGTSSGLPALRDFMIYASVGILFVLVFQSTWFVACLTLDTKRQEAKLLDCLCCIKSNWGPEDGCFGKFDERAPSISQRIIGIFLPKVILHPIGKAAVLIITATLLGFGIAGAVQVTQNFEYELFMPSGSYIRSAYNVRNTYFQGHVIPFSVYTRNLASPPLDYFNYQDQLAALGTDLQASSYVAQVPPLDSWYRGYTDWLKTSSHAQSLTALGRPPTSADFYAWLREFLDSSIGRRYRFNIIFFNSTTRDSIESSQINAYFVTTSNSQEQVYAMNDARSISAAAAPDLQPIAFMEYFLFWEGYKVIAWETTREVIIAGAVVFLVMLITLADVVCTVLVGLMVVFIDIELIGFLHWANLDFNAVSSINLLLAIGIAVDYSAFVAFSFLQQREGTKTERAGKALRHLGVAVFNGGFTMFLAVLPAAGAVSFIFQTFFKMFAMIVLLGLWHGLCALPVILSIIGTEPYDDDDDKAAVSAVQSQAELVEMAKNKVGQANGKPVKAEGLPNGADESAAVYVQEAPKGEESMTRS